MCGESKRMCNKQFDRFLVLTALIFSCLLFFGNKAVAQEIKSSKKRTYTEAEKQRILKKRRLLKKLKEKKIALERERQRIKAEKEALKSHQFSLHDLNPVVRYTYTSDLNEQTDALDGSNNLSLAFSYSPKKRLSLFTGLSIAYETVGSSVFRPSGNEDFFKLSDLYIGAGYQANLKKPLSANFGGSIGIPTSDRSRFEGYKAIGSLNGSILHFIPKYKNLTAGVSSSLDYIFNTFDFSPVSGNPQIQARASVSGTVVYKLPYGLRYIGAIWSSVTLFLDNSDISRLGNTHTLFWTRDNFSAYIRYSNSDLPERGATDFWFIDEYRKIFSIGMVVRAKKPQINKKKGRSRPFVNTSIFEEE